MPPPQKKYICGFCARAFTRSEHKQRHERSHTNEKPFHCLYCTSAFVRRDLLQRHCRTVHNIRLVSRSHYKEERFSESSPKKLPLLVTVPMNKPGTTAGDDGLAKSVVDAGGIDHSSASVRPLNLGGVGGVGGGVSNITNAVGSTIPTEHASMSNHANTAPIPTHVTAAVDQNASTKSSIPQYAYDSVTRPGIGPSHQSAPPTTHDHENDTHIMASAKALLQLAPAKSSRAQTQTLPGTSVYETIPRPVKTTSESGSDSPLTLVSLLDENAKSASRLDHRSGSISGPLGPLGTLGNSTNMAPSSSMATVGSMAAPVQNFIPSGIEHLSTSSPRLDLVQLLSIAKNLEKAYDSEDLQYPVNELFLVGYSVLSNEPYSVFLNFRRSLVENLHSHSSSSALSDFRLGIVYTVLAVGALTCPGNDYNCDEVATLFIKKAWNILVDKLIPQHTSLIFQSEILKNLYVLTYTYLRFFNNDLMLSYLEDSSHIILQNLAAAQNNMSEEIVLMNMDLFWSIYVLVSKYKINEAPPKFYSWFLAQRVFKDSAITLQQFMGNFLKSVSPLSEPFLNEIVICTLSNEVANLTFNQSLWIFDLRNSLHNAIILINKSVNKSVLLASTYSEIFEIFKKKLILNAPPKFKDLMDYYAFQISSPYHWGLLLATLREVNSTFNFDRFMKDNMARLFQKFGNALLEFFSANDCLSIGNSAYEINNNLGIVSFPIIFNYNLLKMNNVSLPVDVAKLNLVDIANLNSLILEWYITMVKILINLFSNNSPAKTQHVLADNTVLQCLMYMITEKEVHFSSASPEVYLQMFNELTKICDTWLNYFNKNTHLATFRMNVNRFLNDLFVLALNQEDFFIGDLYVTNESILIRNRRSKSISSIDTALNNSKMANSRGSISAGASGFGQVPLPAFANTGKVNSNYVLMNKTESSESPPLKARQPSQGFVAMSPSTSLPPLQGVAKLQFASGATSSTSLIISPPIAPPANSLILPPIHAQAREGDKSPLRGFKRVL